MDALNVSEAFVGGYDWGGRAACIMAALWPERVLGLVSCGLGYNIQNIAEAKTPFRKALCRNAFRNRALDVSFLFYADTAPHLSSLQISCDPASRLPWGLI